MTEYLLIPSTGKGWALIGAIVGALFFGGGLLFMKSWQPKPQIEQKPPESRSFDSSQKDKEKGNEDTSKKNEELPEQIIPLSRKASEYGQVPEALSTPPASPQESPAPPVKPHDMLNNDGMSEQEENEQGISYTVRLASPTPTASSSSSSSSSVGSQTFADWQRARAFIEEANDPIDTVSIKFPSHMITEHHSAKEFKKWVSRLNDYMFVYRVTKVKQLIDVITSSDFSRGALADGENHGCALFKKENSNWIIQLRGLGDYTDELIAIVEQIIDPALLNPENIMIGEDLPCVKLSVLMKDAQVLLSENQCKVLDKFVSVCTTTEEMSKHRVDNLGAFLPCVSWEKLQPVEENMTSKICEQRKIFITFIKDNIITKMGDVRKINVVVNKINGDHYGTVTKKFKEFVNKLELQAALKRSLFVAKKKD